ncbi:MAG: hypothetical protein ABS52_18315 [Gemmatimonadetes bacterium SCN 70-22]|nr:MAG: hypothetical protein ABS52_18315 [Gemmatimonadetes bacterium SCN 70-22]
MTAGEAMLAHPSMRALLTGAIDYAGLFPPASLDLSTVVANYRAYRDGPDGWALGRLVVPVARLDELADVAAPSWTTAGLRAGAWRLSVLVGDDFAANASRIDGFNARHAGHAGHAGHAVVDCVETRAATVEQVRALAGVFDGLQHFVELPVTVELPPLMAAVRDIGGRAKIRTGGVTGDAFPAARDVARFLRAAADAGVPFKATAGLHHPLRGEYRLTYEPLSPRGTMFGYLNVFLAAAQARDGAPVEVLVNTLEGRNRAMLGITDEEIRWEGGRASAAALTATREHFALAFGSCSFREPLDDLDTLYDR